MKRKDQTKAHQFTALCQKSFIPLARISLFVVFFWFGFVKLLGVSPAEPLGEALTMQTIGAQYMSVAFIVLAIIECIIGILFLIPRLTYVAIGAMLIHMVMVSSPIILLPDYTWHQFGVLTLEGQYIVKNIVLVALAVGIASAYVPKSKSHHQK